MREDESRSGSTGGAANMPPFEVEPRSVRTAADHQIEGGATGATAPGREAESGREGRPADSALGGTGARGTGTEAEPGAASETMEEPPSARRPGQEALAPSADTAAAGFGNRIQEGMGRAADRLDDAAARLEQVASRAGNGGSGPRQRAGEMAHATADTMESVARYLRESDPQDLRTDLERQVRQRPVQTVLIALAAGWVAGKILR